MEITQEEAKLMYLENYIDFENLPHDVAPLISEFHEIGVKQAKIMKSIDSLNKKYAETDSEDLQLELVEKIERLSLSFQKEADNKLEVAKLMCNMVNFKGRKLDASYRLVESFDSADQSTQAKGSNSPAVIQRENTPTGKRIKKGSGKNNNNESSHSSGDNKPSTSGINYEKNSTITTTKRGQTIKTGTTKKDKCVKRDNNQNTTNTNADANDDDQWKNWYNNIDPNEPTYCICRHISYGDMVLCDNKLCQIKWFHFPCVKLDSKPKGRWYCPYCRGESSNEKKKQVKKSKK